MWYRHYYLLFLPLPRRVISSRRLLLSSLRIMSQRHHATPQDNCVMTNYIFQISGCSLASANIVKAETSNEILLVF